MVVDGCIDTTVWDAGWGLVPGIESSDDVDDTATGTVIDDVIVVSSEAFVILVCFIDLVATEGNSMHISRQLALTSRR